MKVMILYANAGNGHRRAAEALAAVCEEHAEISEWELVDALDYTNKVFQELYANLYIDVVKKAPLLWSKAFDDSDRPWKHAKRQMFVHRTNGRRLVKKIQEFDPDICLCTHFMPADIISRMLREDQIHTALGVIVTDYYVHASWLESLVSQVYVAKEESREQLIQLKFPASRVHALGIPIDPVFENLPSRESLFEKHEISNPELPMILLSAGAFGVMSQEDMSQMLVGIKSSCHLVIVCGNNKNLKQEIDSYVASHGVENITYHVLGFTKEMQDWMAMATLFISKPGGLSTSEGLASGLPMLIWNPIPGQEVFNAIYLLENGAAFLPDGLSTLPYRIDKLLQDPEKLEGMCRSAKAISRPFAARDIVADALTHVDDGVIRVPINKKAFKKSHK